MFQGNPFCTGCRCSTQIIAFLQHSAPLQLYVSLFSDIHRIWIKWMEDNHLLVYIIGSCEIHVYLYNVSVLHVLVFCQRQIWGTSEIQHQFSKQRDTLKTRTFLLLYLKKTTCKRWNGYKTQRYIWAAFPNNALGSINSLTGEKNLSWEKGGQTGRSYILYLQIKEWNRIIGENFKKHEFQFGSRNTKY